MRRSIKIHQWISPRDRTRRRCRWVSQTYSILPTAPLRREGWRAWKYVRLWSMIISSINSQQKRQFTRTWAASMQMAITVSQNSHIHSFSVTIINSTTRRTHSISTTMSPHRICQIMTISHRSIPTNITRWIALVKCSPCSTLTFQLVKSTPALVTWTINSTRQT